MKKLFLGLLFLVCAGLVWFLFIKEYDYQFHLQAKYEPGVVYREVQKWDKFDPDDPNKNIQIISKTPFENLTQEVKNNSSEVELFWEFDKTNDSVTDVTINVKSKGKRLNNRFSIINPFQKSVYIDSLEIKLMGFNKRLHNQQKAYRVNIQKDLVKSPDLDCICHSSVNIPVENKALEMIKTIPFLEDYVLERDIKLTGKPFVKITKWDRNKNLIDFDFCFPVNLAQDIRPAPGVDFRQVKSFSALKATFNGNYRLSDLAWYGLLSKAKERDLKTNALPLEVFYNNPKIDNDPLVWKAEIYLPVVPN